MIVITESSLNVNAGYIDVIVKSGPDGVSTCRGVVVGRATRDEYIAHLRDEHNITEIDSKHGPFYYKVAVD